MLDYIKTRIAVTKTDTEDRSKFVLRELVQNADDAYASILVLRFDKDALYVANDGRAFTTEGPSGQPGDFERASLVLRRFKEDDRESAGHFGSGFQTVYAITNRPEVHSNAISRALNPIEMTWEDTEPHLYSPYMSDPKKKGVLFRLPWRDDKAAESTEYGEAYFKNPNYWPRWNPKVIREFYEDSKRYLQTVILCCQRLRTVRIVWAIGTEAEGFEAVRDFTLENPIERSTAVSVTESPGPNRSRYYEWDRGVSESLVCPSSFARESAETSRKQVFRYLAKSSRVTDEQNAEIHLVKDGKGNVKLARDVSEGRKEIKKNYVHLLIPLFLSTTGNQFLYSVIPLPQRGYNNFVFSAHFIPTEDRKDVDIQGNSEINGKWYRLCILELARLYESLYEEFLQFVQIGTDIRQTDKQAIVLQALPTHDLGDWMRPGRQDTDWAKNESEVLWNWLFDRHILLTPDGRWRSPNEAYAVQASIERLAVEALGLAVFPEPFVIFAKGVPWIQSRAEKRKFDELELVRIWAQVWEANKVSSVRYGKAVSVPASKSRVDLTYDVINNLITYVFSASDRDSLSGLLLFPDSVGEFHELDSFPRLPRDFADFEATLSDSERLNKDFVARIGELETQRPIRSEVSIVDLPDLISQAVEDQPDRYKTLDSGDHRLLSQAVTTMILHKSFAPDHVIGKYFLPFRFDGAVHVGTPPEVDGQHIGEKYQRDWIFAQQFVRVPGMTSEIENSIRFLSLQGISEDKVEKVETRLNIAPLAETETQPVNFIRHFISGLHGSLFVDNVLAKLLGRSDIPFLTKQKKTLLQAVKVYFKNPKTERGLAPDDMGEIPCLYDLNGDWYPAKDFAVGTGGLSAALKFRQLHRDFDDWKPSTLEALGVVTEIDPRRVAKRISELAQNPQLNRRVLANIVGSLIKGFDNSAEIANNLSKDPWIPTIRGLSLASQSVYPSEATRDIIGDSDPSLVDLGAMDDDARKSVLSMKPSQLNANLDLLGIQQGPSLEQMTGVASLCSTRGSVPPRKLFETLSALLSSLPPQQLGEWKKKNQLLKFYSKGRWFAGEKIRILPSGNESKNANLSATLLVLSDKEAFPVDAYLMAIGAGKGPSPSDYLEELELITNWAKRSPEKSEELVSKQRNLWEQLELFSDKISSDIVKRFQDSKLFYVDGKWHTASNVLLDDKKTTDVAISFGETCIVPIEVSPKTALAALGSLKVSELARDRAATFMSKCGLFDSLTENLAETYLRILILGERQDWWTSRNILRWPSVIGHQIRFRLPQDSFLANNLLRGVLKNVPILLTVTKEGFHGELENLARKWGAKSLSGQIRVERMPLESSRETESILSSLYFQLARIHQGSPGLDWLKNLKVYRVQSKGLKYIVDKYSGVFSIPAIVPYESDTAGLFVLDEDEFPPTAADAIAGWAVGSGFPPDKVAELASTMMVLYSNLESQNYFASQIPGYSDTLNSLSGWYQGCQICGATTPHDESSGETMESIRSIVSERGGMLKGKLVEYEIGNSLYLCPRHAILMQRGLVKFDFLNDVRLDKRKVTGLLQNALEEVPKQKGLNKITIQSYEGNFLEDIPKGWRPVQLNLHPKHAKELFDRLLRYIG